MKTPTLRHLCSASSGSVFCVLAASLLAVTGCDAEFDPGSQVNSLRVLAVQADSPYAAPGETVRLQALSFDPLGRPITWAWALCPNPSSSSVEACLLNVIETAASTGSAPLLGTGVGMNELELTIPENALDAIAPSARPQALLGVLSVACPGTLDLNAQPSDASPLPIRCSDAAGNELGLHDTIVGVKRIFLRQTDRNANPIIERITFDGEDWPADEIKEVDSCDTDEFAYDDCKGDPRHDISAVLSPESFETGTDEFGRTYSEELIVQHFTTDGIFEFEVRVAADPVTGWVSRKSAAGSEIPLWFVARDDRGGVTYAERTVRVR